MVEMPEIDRKKCTGCGLCVSVCHCHALKIVNNSVTITESERCGWCTQCESICPAGAISCAFEIVIEDQS